MTSNFGLYHVILQSVYSTLHQITAQSMHTEGKAHREPIRVAEYQGTFSGTLSESHISSSRIESQQLASSAMLYRKNDDGMGVSDSRRSSIDTLVADDAPSILYDEKSMGGDVIQASIYRSSTRRKLCVCRCHAPTTVKTPR